MTVKNSSKSVAFMTHLRLTRGPGGDNIVPVFWSDNYFSLLPGEERRVTGTYDVASREGKPALLIVDGFNVIANTVQPASAVAGAAN